MKRTTFGRIGMVGIIGLGLVLTACNRRDEAPPMGDMHGDMPMGQHEGMGGMHGMEGMHMDPGMMQRHAQEADTMASRMRQHVQQMRQLSPEQQHERMGEHVTHVSQMLGLMNRQMREMDMGMGMSDEQMGQMMGMSGEEHRRMMGQMQAIRTDVEQLQTASLPDVRQRMPAHLDRLDQMVRTMEQSAEHMRSM
jgi:hypothetical protein